VTQLQKLSLAGAIATAASGFFTETASSAQRMTRTLKGNPAVVIAAFGTSTRAQVTYGAFERQLREALPDYEVRWAFTSEVIRQIVNARWARQGIEKRLLSLHQVLANLQADGYTEVAVQPLHIFPGEEYEEVLGIVAHFPGLRVETGETLLQRWETVREVIELLSRDFLTDDLGCNVIVAHGTPSTHVGSNITYLGLDRMLSRRFTNVHLGAVEGVIAREDALDPAKRHDSDKVRFIPLMYVAGDHIMNDIMGEGESTEGPSWRTEIEAAGKTVDVPTLVFDGETYYRGLGFIPEVNEIYIREIERSLGRL
jgi:sirohydrochlorin cobaltochelatase